jgi:hypothetical protein
MEHTLDINSPNMPPSPAPITPDNTVLPAQLSMPIVIYALSALVLLGGEERGSREWRRTHFTICFS